MTPKKKAEELFYKMSTNSSDEDHHCSHYVAKNCALIAVNEMIEIRNEIINTLKLGALDIEVILFLEEVKQEIENI